MAEQIITYVLNAVAIGNLIAFIFILLFGRKIRQLMRMATAYGTMLRTGRTTKEQAQKLTDEQLSARRALVQNIKGKIPFGLTEGMEDNQIISLLQDEQFMKGVLNIASIAAPLLGAGARALGAAADKIQERTAKSGENY